MLALLFALQAFPTTGRVSMRVDGGMWNNEVIEYPDTVLRWCCVEIWPDSTRENPSPLEQVQRVDIRHRMRQTVRDYAYYGYPAHYDDFNPLASPGDTVPVYVTIPKASDSSAYYPTDSTLVWLIAHPGNVGPSPDTLAQAWVNDSAQSVNLGVIRPLPGDSVIFQGCYHWYHTVNAAVTAHPQVECSGFLTMFSDSLFFPPISPVTIDTLPPNQQGAMLFEDGFEDGTLAAWGVEHEYSHSGTVVDATVREGLLALRSEIRPTDSLVFNGHRAEVRLNKYPDVTGSLGDERWFGFSIYIPTTDPVWNDWRVLAQWHSWPDTALGETWRSPPLYLGTFGDNWQIVARWDSNEVSTGNPSPFYFGLRPWSAERGMISLSTSDGPTIPRGLPRYGTTGHRSWTTLAQRLITMLPHSTSRLAFTSLPIRSQVDQWWRIMMPSVSQTNLGRMLVWPHGVTI